jgi:hypothetical protein
MTLYFLQRYEDLQSKIKYQNKATYLHNIHEVVHERDQQEEGNLSIMLRQFERYFIALNYVMSCVTDRKKQTTLHNC